MIKTVAIYCRVSTEEQKKYGISIDDQKNSLIKYCEENNYKIYDYYMDEGISAGTISKRKAFLRMLDDLDNIDLIIFTRLDRFSRNVRDANNILVILDEHNTAFRAIDEDDIDVSTADGRFIFNLKVNLAEREKNIDSERIRRANKYRYEVAKKVCTGKLPFGYKVSKDKTIEINNKEANKVIDLYNYFIDTNNLGKTVQWFSNKYGYKSDVTIKRYLKNTCYIGLYKTYSGEVIEDYCPAILEEEVFYKAQSIFEKNIKNYSKKDSSRKKTPYIFTGMVKCPSCMRRMSGKSNANDKHYYDCRHHWRHNCDFNKCIREIDIENYLLNNIKKVVQEKLARLDNVNSKEGKKVDIKPLKEKLNKLTNLYINDLIDIDYYKKQYTELKTQIDDAKNEETPKTIKKEDIERLRNILKSDFMSLYNNLDNIEKRKLWSSIVDYVIVNDKDNIDIIVY